MWIFILSETIDNSWDICLNFVFRVSFPNMLSKRAVVIIYFITPLVATLVLRPLFLFNYINVDDMCQQEKKATSKSIVFENYIPLINSQTYLFIMNGFVLLQIWAWSESFITFIADIGFVASVNSRMPYQITHLYVNSN